MAEVSTSVNICSAKETALQSGNGRIHISQRKLKPHEGGWLDPQIILGLRST